MRYYENLFIVNPSYEGDSLETIKEEYASFIAENGGKVYSVDDWGKRRLAYTIEKQKYGTYVLIEFGADGSLIRELEDSQRLNDSVLGYLTVRLEEEPDMTRERRRPVDDDETGDENDEEDEEDEEEDESEEEDEHESEENESQDDDSEE